MVGDSLKICTQKKNVFDGYLQINIYSVCTNIFIDINKYSLESINIFIDVNEYLFQANQYLFARRPSNELFFWVHPEKKFI